MAQQSAPLEKIGPYAYDYLKPLGKYERDEMTQVHSIRRRPTSSVQEKRFLLFIQVKDPVDLSVGEKDATFQQMVHWFTGNRLKPRQ